MRRLGKKRIKALWDEYRLTKQISEGRWYLIIQPDPPAWFIIEELEQKMT